MAENPCRFFNRKGREYKPSELALVYYRAKNVYNKYADCEICKQKILNKRLTKFKGKMVCPDCLNKDECGYYIPYTDIVSNASMIMEY